MAKFEFKKDTKKEAKKPRPVKRQRFQNLKKLMTQ